MLLANICNHIGISRQFYKHPDSIGDLIKAEQLTKPINASILQQNFPHTHTNRVEILWNYWIRKQRTHILYIQGNLINRQAFQLRRTIHNLISNQLEMECNYLNRFKMYLLNFTSLVDVAYHFCNIIISLYIQYWHIYISNLILQTHFVLRTLPIVNI